MRTLPPAPNPGEKISASLIRELIRAIRERTPIAGHGTKLSIGPNGVRIDIEDFKSKSKKNLPWTFYCHEDENGERTGGWSNGRLQVGYDCRWATPDLTNDADYKIADTDTVDDGDHYLKVDLANNTVNVVISNPTDYQNNIVGIYIGTVSSGELIFGIHMNPVCYHLV